MRAAARWWLALVMLACPLLAHAEQGHLNDFKSQAEAACLAHQALVGEVAPTYGCAHFSGGSPAAPGAAGHFITHSPNDYHVFYYLEVDTEPPNECEALVERQNDPSDSMYLAPTDTRAYSGSGAMCSGGCQIQVTGGHTETTANGVTMKRGRFAFSGASCEPTPESPPPATPPPKPVDPVCAPASNGQTFCLRQDGQQCYTLSDGSRQMCWDPTATGTKTDGSTAQVRGPGTTTPTAPAPPPGETLAPNGNPTTSTTTTISSTGSTVSSVITTVQNFVTGFGTNAGPVNQGSPTGTPGGAEIGGETGTVNGTGECDQQYTISGGDPVANKILQEIHAANCAARDEYTYQGDGLGDLIATDDGGGDGEAGTGVVDVNAGGANGILNAIDQAGLGSGQGVCPVLPSLGEFGSIDQTKFCEYGALLGWIFLAVALVWAAQVVFG